MRADNAAAFEAALASHRGQGRTGSGNRRRHRRRHRRHRETQTETETGNETQIETQTLIVEAFVPGGELVLQGVLTQGALHVLASVAVSEGPRTRDGERLAGGMVAHAAAALGLGHGPIHAVCRVNVHGVFILTLSPWPMEARLASRLRFATRDGVRPAREGITLPELLLRHAAGEALDAYGREV